MIIASVVTNSSAYTEEEPPAALAAPRAMLADLTAVRGLFALWVFAYHCNLHLHFAGFAGLIGRGYLGVDGFFILSGLVLARRYPHSSLGPPGLLGFWWRRLVRLYPTALAMLLLLGCIYVLARMAGIRPHEALRANEREFLLQLVMLNGWGLSRGWTWNYPSWSVSTEWAGYLLFPLLAAPLARLDTWRAAAVATALGGLLLLLAAASPAGLNLTYAGALARFGPEFASGIVLAGLLSRGLPRRFALLAALAGLGLLLLGVGVRVATPLGDGVIAIALWLLIAALGAGRQTVLARLPMLLGLGGLSYPFYMAYAPVELLFARAWGHWHLDPARAGALWLPPMFLAVLGLAWLTAVLVERPALRYLAGRRADR